jgi:hypothetical protein
MRAATRIARAKALAVNNHQAIKEGGSSRDEGTGQDHRQTQAISRPTAARSPVRVPLPGVQERVVRQDSRILEAQMVRLSALATMDLAFMLLTNASP